MENLSTPRTTQSAPRLSVPPERGVWFFIVGTLVLIGLSPIIASMLVGQESSTTASSEPSEVESADTSSSLDKEADVLFETNPYELCEEPQDLSELQVAIPFGVCDFIVVEIQDDGTFALISGNPEYFEAFIDPDSWEFTKGTPTDSNASRRSNDAPSPRSRDSGSSGSEVPSYDDVIVEYPEGYSSPMCPVNRAENPAVYDACRVGYSRPAIVPVGIVACSALNEERTAWSVTYQLALSGGNYRDPLWSGVSQGSGSTAFITNTITGLGEESLNQRLPFGFATISVSFGSMDPRYTGGIDNLSFQEDLEGDFSICR
jgi:hypothetical protein